MAVGGEGFLDWLVGTYTLTRVGGDDDEREVPQPVTLALLALALLVLTAITTAKNSSSHAMRRST